MKTVHKIGLSEIGPSLVRLPDDYRIVHVGEQGGQVMMWVELDPTAVLVPVRRFQIFGTGHSIPDHAEYVGTTQVGPFVWHVYQI